jgi:hypothetical protein
MAKEDKSLPPQEIISKPDAEVPGKEGTLGGAQPLGARAGIQSAKDGGVLDVVRDGAQASNSSKENAASPSSKE